MSSVAYGIRNGMEYLTKIKIGQPIPTVAPQLSLTLHLPLDFLINLFQIPRRVLDSPFDHVEEITTGQMVSEAYPQG